MVDQVGKSDAEPMYDELADYLESHGDIAGGLDGLSDLSDLARAVKTAAVRSLLLGRDPYILEPENPRHFATFLEQLNGVATEVESVVGTDPQAAVRRLALWAIALGVAAGIEDALYPEQQLGGQDATGGRIRARYLAILAQLRGLPGVAPDGALAGAGGPLGDFPAPLPDPFLPDTVVGYDLPRWIMR